MSGYTIKIRQFEGPFELLLFFIERDELDIKDIPISKITADFLEYIKQLEELNLDVASEFIVVAANLMRIKARMLLPRREVDELGNEIDPREDLVNRLIEYKKFKDAVGDLRLMEEDRQKLFSRGNIEKELAEFREEIDEDKELEKVSLFKLLSAFNLVIGKFENRQTTSSHRIFRYPYTIEKQSEYILKKLTNKKRAGFHDFFEGMKERMEAIVTFLAMLELLNGQKIRITQGKGNNNFWLAAH